jgi:formylglycine-generating enzyme required for sulfatase activity
MSIGLMAQNKTVKEGQQYLLFQVSPTNALLEVDDQIWELDANGTAKKYVNFGKHTYRVQAKNYHTDEGQITVDDPNNTMTVKIVLRPNFGWIEVPGSGNLQGASIYIDNNYVGRAPFKSEALNSGSHTVRIVKEMYAAYSETVTVVDNETVRLEPSLGSDMAEVTLKVDADAEIWVNNKQKGIRTWTGALASGTYRIECKKVNHETTVTTKEITPNMSGQTIVLPAPKPILASLMVESVPNFCSVYVDGMPMGETPKFISEIVMGQHELKLSKEGYVDHVETIYLENNERKQVSATLASLKSIQFSSNAPEIVMEIDGKKVGSANGIYHLALGEHTIHASASGYIDYNAVFTVTDNTVSHEIKMLKEEEEFTVNGVNFKMKLVEGGTYQMGDDSQWNEKPAHEVTVSTFFMGETVVTQALWQAVMGNNPSEYKGNDLPVETVSWNDCQNFINKLNQLTGKKFRLPTEAEWEYAARGGKYTHGYLYAGCDDKKGIWYTPAPSAREVMDIREGKMKPKQKFGEKPVKSKKPNELGLYEMSGNMWEWCSDWYDNYKAFSQTNPEGVSNGTKRVLRGGSWDSESYSCRVTSRGCTEPTNRESTVGLRLCLPQ